MLIWVLNTPPFLLYESSNVLFLKVNHLAYIEPRWYGSQISADCQQNLFSTKHDTSGRFLPVTFLEEQKTERMARKW